MENPKQHLNQNSQKIPETICKEAMVRNNIAWMISVADRLLSDRTLAEDVVQEAFILAFRGLDKFQNRSSLKTWLHSITVNTALMKLRKLKCLAEQPIDEYLPEFDKNGCRIEASWRTIASTEDIVANEQHRLQIHTAINQLPDTYRIVLLLRDIEGYNTNEVAHMLEISTNNVKVRLHRARSALKKLIEPVLRNRELV